MRAARVDVSHPAFVTTLRLAGCSVLSLASVGRGAPDLLVGWRGLNLLVEVKTPGAANRRRKTGKDAERLARQTQFREAWAGEAIEAEYPEEVLWWYGVHAPTPEEEEA